MNKAITDGLVLMPPPFAQGLGVWSSGDGTPGSDSYAVSGTGAFVPADQDFGGCLEILKSATTTKLRYMGETTILPGCYLRITARVKAVSGALPAVRIAGWAGGAGGANVSGLTEVGPATQLTAYGQIEEISAIVGTGDRTGVDMVWSGANFGHFGLDLTGPNGGLVRVDDIVIEDITIAFLRDIMSVVDVRDYGARGDGVTDDSAAFEAADNAASGRMVLVSKGVFYLGSNVTIDNRIRFEGTVTMPDDKALSLQKNFDYGSYLDAFGEEALAFRKAFQALLGQTDHESLDLQGHRVSLSAPIDMAAAAAKTAYATRRVVRNGQFVASDSTDWATTTVTSQATYTPSSRLTLTNVVNIANIPVGSLVIGNGVGREVYVSAVNVAAQSLTLSQPLFGAAGTQVFTFRRFKYLIDFSGFDQLSQFNFDDVEFQGNGYASGIMLAKQGLTFHLRDCFINKPRDRGITSIGTGCQGMMIDRCEFLSNEQNLTVPNRTTIGLNVNGNDVKIRENRAVKFRHFCVLTGTGNMVVGNHWFQGDVEAQGVRVAGIVLTTPNCSTQLTGNYIDNNSIEWTNEHSEDPDLGVQYSFGGLSLTGNFFLCSDVAPWFSFIVMKPYGSGHFIQGLTVQGNVFKSTLGNIDRLERVDTTYADLDYGRMRNILFEGNTFNAINQASRNPVLLEHVQSTADKNWVVESIPELPFNGRLRTVGSVVKVGKITDAGNVLVTETPYCTLEYGPAKSQVRLVWGTACTGTVRVQARMDEPN